MMDNTAIKRLTLVTDAWQPQINGVVTTLNQLVNHLTHHGVEVDVVHPYDYRHIGTPTYREIPLVLSAPNLEQRILDFKPQALHIATEGSLGWRARKIAMKHQLPFTSAYHTKYPEYLTKRLPIKAAWVYKVLRRFHRAAQRTFVPAPAILHELEQQGFNHLTLMGRGVDKTLFNPLQRIDLPYPRPIHLYVGRVAIEKNIEAFLALDVFGSKLVVGDGPAKADLQRRFPNAIFVGAKQGKELAEYYASADVMVFPSLTDTFGLVNIEAMACGTPVAAFPVTGPIDIITPGVNGAVHHNLALAVDEAMSLPREGIEDSVADYDWSRVAQQFLTQLYPINPTP